METLDSFCFDTAALVERRLAIRNAVPEGRDVIEGSTPSRLFQRMICSFQIAPGQRWLDARSPSTHANVRRAMTTRFHQLGIVSRITPGDLLGSDYRVPQTFTRWAIDNGYQGIVYASCHDLETECWALFEGVQLETLGKPEKITKNDPDLLAVAKIWSLEIPA